VKEDLEELLKSFRTNNFKRDNQDLLAEFVAAYHKSDVSDVWTNKTDVEPTGIYCIPNLALVVASGLSPRFARLVTEISVRRLISLWKTRYYDELTDLLAAPASSLPKMQPGTDT